MALTQAELNRLRYLEEQRKKSLMDSNPAPKVPRQSFSQNTKDFGKGFVKGGFQSAIETARALQSLGQGTMAAIDPNRTFSEVRNQTGINSLQGKEAEEIDQFLKSNNTAERAGKITQFAASLLTPTGVRNVASKGFGRVSGSIDNIIDNIPPGGGGSGGSLSKIATNIGDTVGMVKDSVSRIPSRIATNIAERQATRQTIKKLPTEIAQQSAQDGIDPGDVEFIYKIPKEQKEPLKKLFNVVKEFSRGNKQANPIEVVGKPIVQRIKELESARMEVGKKLGEISKTFGNVSSPELFSKVFDRLKRVPGLEGIKVNKNGVLNFSDTVLTTAETKADRKAIQSIFLNATKWGKGFKKHLLRQELFEVLGGKKKGLANLTDTQERAYEAIREGLSDVLETKNSSYKSLSSQYRKILQPLKEMRKLMKNVAGSDEDILDMSAGLLARRLTSNAASNPQIKSILRAMDEATKTKGKAGLNTETLQDFYNILNRYYDIAGKTGFQGQVTAGIERVGGIKDALVGVVREVAGETDAVRQKALERIIEEALR